MTVDATISLAGSRRATVFASGARAATPHDQEFDGLNGENSVGLVAVLDLTAFTTAASLTLNILGVDRTSGKTWLIASTGVLVANGTYVVKIHPNDSTAAMGALSGGLAYQSQQGQVPPVIRVQVVHGNANSHTYSVGLNFTG